MQEEQGNTKRRKTQNTKTASQVKMVDMETGEVLDDGITIHVPRKQRITGFFMANQNGFEELARKGLKAEAYRVLMFLMGQMDYENAISVSQKEIAETLNMKKQNVSRALQSLRAAGAFENEANHVVYLSTEIGWKGKVQNLHKRNAKAFRDCGDRTAPTDADWKKMDVRIDALPKFSEAAARIINPSNATP